MNLKYFLIDLDNLSLIRKNLYIILCSSIFMVCKNRINIVLTKKFYNKDEKCHT